MDREPNTGENPAGSRVMVSPKNGAVCPVGHHHPNQVGKKGRSGRRPDRVKRACARIAEEGLPFMRAVVHGHAVQQRRVEGEVPKWEWIAADLDQRLKAWQAVQRAATERTMTDEEVRRALKATLEIVAETFGDQPERLAEAFDAIERVWR